MSENKEKNLGKKIFFLYPHSVIQDELITEIIRNEFEAYVLKDHKKGLSILRQYNDSILFINIDTVLKEPEWEEYIREIMEDPLTKDVKIGILTYNNDDELMQKYLMEVMIQCGFIRLKIGFEQSKKIILKTLEANEAKGRRKYIRAHCSSKISASFNAKIDHILYSGKIMDVSSVGMACTFDDQKVKLIVNDYLEDIQLRLKGNVCMVSGKLVGIREGDVKVYVILFDHQKMSSTSVDKIYHFIYSCHQSQIDDLIKKAGKKSPKS